MGASAFRTSDPADPEADGTGREFYIAFVVTVNGKAGGMAAGASQLMELKLINNGIIKRLRNLLAIWSKNGYHSIVDRHR